MAIQINVTLPEELLAEVKRTAAVEQRSHDEVIQEAVERYLRLKRREELYAFGEGQAPKLGIREEDIPDLVRQTRQSVLRAR